MKIAHYLFKQFVYSSLLNITESIIVNPFVRLTFWREWCISNVGRSSIVLRIVMVFFRNGIV